MKRACLFLLLLLCTGFAHAETITRNLTRALADGLYVPVSRTITAGTGLGGGCANLAANCAFSLADTSAAIRTALTDESGTGALIFANGALGTPTATTIQTSGNVGFGGAPSATAGQFVTVEDVADQATVMLVNNTNAIGTNVRAVIRAKGDAAQASLIAHGAGATASRFGVVLGGWGEFLVTTSSATKGLVIGTASGANGGLILGTVALSGFSMDTSQRTLFGTGALTPSITSGSDLQVLCGGSTTPCGVGGALFYSVTEVGNVGTGEDALIPAVALPAALFVANGDSIFVRANGGTANNANVKRIRVRLIEGANDNVIYDAGASAIITNSDWVLTCEVVRESATLFKSSCNISTTSVSGLTYADFATGTYTFANAGTIAVTAEATSDNDVVMEAWKGRWDPAP